ncbi:hypothetical protein ACOSQ4_012326 [Xanthoceras sorbifolium]
MAPKKPNPMEEPPAASSSDDEEEETEEEEASSEDEEEDDEGTPEPTQLSSPPPQQTPKQGAAKKPEAAAATTPQSKSSSSEDESGSESESESEADQTPKPIATKPMEETPKTTKPRSKPPSKRPNETDAAQKDVKRVKKGTDADADEEEASESKKPGEDTKKQLFQRLWSEDDEIAVLKGMIEFSTKKGVDPNQDMNAFHDFIKKSLHVDVSRNQLVDKIRRLKKKYENNLERGIKKGEDRTFSKPHEQKAYDLSKKVWGGEGSGGVVESAAKSNGKARKIQNQRGNSKQLAALKAELLNGPKEVEKMEVDNDKELSLKTPMDVEKFLFDKSLGVAGLEDYVVKNGLDMIGGSKKTELEQRWKKLHIAQLELFVERIDLVKEQAVLMLESLKSADN